MAEAGPAEVPVITLDGPSGSGKGTIARQLARRLRWHLLDSGALYRAVALRALELDIDLEDAPALAQLAAALPVRFQDAEDETSVYIDGRCVDAQLRTEMTGEAASRVARHPAVRAALTELQRSFARPPGLVADGRDMGTVIFADARFKFFLTASPEERARRRHKQLKQKGISVSLPALAREIEQRDERDSQRSAAPLRPAEDAWVIDSTQLGADEVFALILQWLAQSGVGVNAGCSGSGQDKG